MAVRSKECDELRDIIDALKCAIEYQKKALMIVIESSIIDGSDKFYEILARNKRDNLLLIAAAENQIKEVEKR